MIKFGKWKYGSQQASPKSNSDSKNNKKQEKIVARVENYNIEEEYMIKPKRESTPIIEIYDSLLNYLVDNGIVELPKIEKYKFLNGVLDYYRFEEFCNYHNMICY